MDEPNPLGVNKQAQEPGRPSASSAASPPHDAAAPTSQTSPKPGASDQGRPVRWVRGVLSALVPGLGQLAAGRIGDAALFLVAVCWTRLFFAGLAADGERLSAALGGAFGMARGLAMPTVVVITVITLGLHVFAAWDAARKGRPDIRWPARLVGADRPDA